MKITPFNFEIFKEVSIYILLKYNLNMEKYIDLTFKANINDNEMRELLNKPGFYRIPIKNYSLFNDTPVIKEVEVVYVTPKESRMPSSA